jgi:hypothetical protein
MSFAIGRALVGAGRRLASCRLPSSGGQRAASGFTVPRTAGVIPISRGKWPGTSWSGVPMQRDELGSATC